METNTKKDPWFILSLILGGVIVGFILGTVFSGSNTQTYQITLGTHSGGDSSGSIGRADAPVLVEEYSDYMCPYCQRFYEMTFDKIIKTYVDTGKVRFVYKDFPIGSHKNAKPAAMAARCAGDQGNYYGMHDALFVNMDVWNRLPDPTDSFVAMAKKLKLNKNDFSACLKSGKFDASIAESVKESVSRNNTGTPGFFINGQYVSGALPFSVFQEKIEEELAKIQPAQ